MATRLFLHAAANALSGTFPTAEQSVTFSARYVATGGNTLRTMDSLTGVSQTTLIASLSASGTYQVFFGHFCSPTLASDQTIGSGAQTLTLNLGLDTSLTSTSATAVATNLYIWRPSTGAKVGTVYDGIMNPIDIASGTTQRTWNTTISAAASVSALAGDVIIVECWRLVKPTAATARSVRMYYDGTVVSTTQSATSSNHAAFLDFATDTIVFSQPPVSASFAQTLAAVTLAGTGTSPCNGSFDNTLGTATLAGTGDVPHTSTFGNTLAAIALSGAAAVPHASTFDNSLAAATLVGTGEVVSLSPIEGTFSNTLSGPSLVALANGNSFTPPATPETAGSGAAKTGQKKKFVVPLQEEPAYVDRMFDDLKPLPKPVEVIENTKRATLLADSLAAMTPNLVMPEPATPTVQRVKPTEPDDDSDMIMIAMLL